MLKVVLLDPKAQLPTVANPGEDLGFDIYALEADFVEFGKVTKLRTGIAACYDDGSSGRNGMLIRGRSSFAAQGLITLGGVIDAGYTGEIFVMMSLLENRYGSFRIAAGLRIAQMIPVPVRTGDQIVAVSELAYSIRRHNGFGSSGK